VDLNFFETHIKESFFLILEHWISIDTYQGATSRCEILDHHLTKPIIWVEHLVIQEKADVKLIADGLQHFVELVCVDVTDYTFTEEQCGFSE
jgi:hypothetical protein